MDTAKAGSTDPFPKPFDNQQGRADFYVEMS